MPDVHRALGRPKSRYPGASSWRQRGIAEPSLFGAKRRRVTPRCGDDPRAGHQGFLRSEPFNPLRAERRTMFGARGDYARVFELISHTRLRTRDASGVPRALILMARMRNTSSARALGEREGSGAPAPFKNRGDEAWVEQGAGFLLRERGKPRARCRKQQGDHAWVEEGERWEARPRVILRRHSGARAKQANPESILLSRRLADERNGSASFQQIPISTGVMDSGFAPSGAPRNDGGGANLPHIEPNFRACDDAMQRRFGKRIWQTRLAEPIWRNGHLR